MHFRFLSVLLLSVFASLTSSAQNPSAIELNNRLSILNDRAFFNFPDSAKNIARPVDIMSADPNANRETRIMMDFGTHRLVFFAVELFMVAGDDFVELVSQETIPGFTFERKVLLKTDSLLAVLSTPLNFDSTSGSIPINRLTVKTHDGSIFRMDAYINPPAFGQVKDYIKLSERVFSSMKKGTRFPNLKPRWEHYPIFDLKDSLAVHLPQNWNATIGYSHDFMVYQLSRYEALGQNDRAQLVIYFGNHPSPGAREMGFKDEPATIMGTFLGEKVEWQYYAAPERNLFLQEKVIPVDQIDKGLLAHVAMFGSSPSDIETMRKMVEEVKLKK